MDCSNPVFDSSRMTIGQMMTQVGLLKRQDLNYLATLATGAVRNIMPEMVRREVGGDQAAAELKEVSEKVQCQVSPSKALSVDFLKVKHESVSVSGLSFQGVALHPPGKNQKGGSVCANRLFGGGPRDKILITKLLEFLTPDQFQDQMAETVYSNGTSAGFQARLKEQTTRKCQSIYLSSGVQSPKGRCWMKMSKDAAQKRIAQLFPTREVDVDVSEPIEVQIDQIQTSKISSAGAPYWKTKPDSVAEMKHTVMPLVLDCIAEKRLDKLYEEQPELFLAECRNKKDRYDVGKLDSKCRPYFAYPFHWQALFSMISQPFSKSLKQFYEGGVNAYGFSWAHGGGSKIAEFAKSIGELGTKEGRPRFYVYGDDVDLFYRVKGVLYRVSPDFRQMDGSVDAECVDLCIKYMLDTVVLGAATKEGKSPEEIKEVYYFWKTVGSVWRKMACDPPFIVDGTKVYQKPQCNGLCTGVVGTTFFDTVKAAFAYDAYCTQVHEYKMRGLLTASKATEFFRTLGLEIKEGTWNPSPVLEQPSPGQLWSPNKFLGVQLKWEEGNEKPELVPYLSFEDWMKLICVPRDQMQEGGKPMSATSYQRLQFDRLRGYLITGAFSNEEVRLLINGMINDVNPVSILMAVQADGGKGEKPEAGHVCGDDFSYPTSDGIPSELWARNLYLSEGNKFPEEVAPWVPVFPGLLDKIAEWKEKNSFKLRRPRMALIETAAENPDKGGTIRGALVEEVEKLPVILPPANPALSAMQVYETDWHEAMLEEEQCPDLPLPRAAKASQVTLDRKPLKHSVRMDSSYSEKPHEVKAKLPTLRQLLEEFLSTTEITMESMQMRPGYIVDEYKRIASKRGTPEFASMPLAVREMANLAYEESNKLLQMKDAGMGGSAKARLFCTPVLSLDETANRIGLDPEVLARRARKLGYLVLGPRGNNGPQWLFKVPPQTDPAFHGPGMDRMCQMATRQIAENHERSHVISKEQATIKKLMQRGARGWETASRMVSGEAPEYVKGLAYTEARIDMSAQHHAERILNVNKIPYRWMSKNKVVGKKSVTETVLLTAPQEYLGKPRDEIQFDLWLKSEGQNSEQNRETISAYVIDYSKASGKTTQRNNKKGGTAVTGRKGPLVGLKLLEGRDRGRVICLNQGVEEELLVLRGVAWTPGKAFKILQDQGWVWDPEQGVRSVQPGTEGILTSGLRQSKSETLTVNMKRVTEAVRRVIPNKRSYYLFSNQNLQDVYPNQNSKNGWQNGTKKAKISKAAKSGGEGVRYSGSEALSKTAK